MKELLFTRKYNKEEYRFFIKTMVSWADNKPIKYISVETPEIRKIKETIIKAGYEKYIL